MCFYYKVAYTGWLTNNINLHLTDLEAGKSKMKALADSVSGESLLLITDQKIHIP